MKQRNRFTQRSRPAPCPVEAVQFEGRGPSSLRNELAPLIRGDDATQPITSCHERLTAKISRLHHRVENTLEITANPKHLPKEKQILHFSTIKAKSTSPYLEIFWDHQNSKAGNSDHGLSPGDNEAFRNVNKSPPAACKLIPAEHYWCLSLNMQLLMQLADLWACRLVFLVCWELMNGNRWAQPLCVNAAKVTDLASSGFIQKLHPVLHQ